MLDDFYDECADASGSTTESSKKFIGHAVLAVFNFPYTRADHAEQAALAALDIQGRWARIRAPAGDGGLGIGIGIQSGQASIGEIGKACKEFPLPGRS